LFPARHRPVGPLTAAEPALAQNALQSWRGSAIPVPCRADAAPWRQVRPACQNPDHRPLTCSVGRS